MLLAVLLISASLRAQQTDSINSPKALVQNFFEAFHAKDSVRLKNFAMEEARLTSITKNATGATELKTMAFSDFIKNILSISETDSFEEKLHAFRVEENGLLATVTTPYSFYYNGKLLHCGVNSFQLVKFEAKWKIVYIMDTRSRENCD